MLEFVTGVWAGTAIVLMFVFVMAWWFAEEEWTPGMHLMSVFVALLWPIVAPVAIVIFYAKRRTI
jgi:hypothetical protein